MRSGDFLLLFESCGVALLCHAFLVRSGVLVSEGNGAFQWRWFKGVGDGLWEYSIITTGSGLCGAIIRAWKKHCWEGRDAFLEPLLLAVGIWDHAR